MKLKYLNPFFLYSVAFLLSIGLYHLKLSGLYNFSAPYIESVILITIAFSVVLYFIYSVTTKKFFKYEYVEKISKKNCYKIAFLLIILASAEFIYSKTVPIISLASGVIFDYQDFGIPVLHVFIMSYISGHAIMSFYRLIKGCGKYNLIGLFIGIGYSVSIVSRGTAMLIIVPCLLLYLANAANRKSIIYAFIFFIITIIGFGVMGDARFQSQGVTVKNPIYQIGRIDPTIETLGVPSGFVWFYVYASSPYSNLLNQERLNFGDKYGFGDLVITSILPDFVAKRLKDPDEYASSKLLTPELNVSTGYALPYLTMGEIGIIIMFLYYVLYVLVFTALNKNKNIHVISSVYSSAGALMIFYNMLVFSTCFLQLLIITIFSRINISGNRLI